MVTDQSATMMALVYQIVLWLGLPVVWLRLQLRARRDPSYAPRQSERFGKVPGEVRQNCVWFHTVSAGETMAASPLIRQLSTEFSDLPFLVTTMTPTGSEQVIQRLADCVDHCYAPYDFKFAVRRFFDAVQPRLLVLMETELWPNLIAEAHQRGVRVVLVNARLSARSARGYSRVPGLTKTMLTRLSNIACQSEEHLSRFVALGASAITSQALGSVKYDVALPEDFEIEVADLRAKFSLGDRPLWIAASTHPGEDELILQAFTQVRGQNSKVCLLLVPRHPVRAQAVSALVVDAGYKAVRHSEYLVTSASPPPEGTPDVVVGDVMGSLLHLYGLAQIAFVGGSFVEMGGHNPLEPALCEIPILCGPYQFNFTHVMQDLERRGALRTVQDPTALANSLIEYFDNADLRVEAGKAALGAFTENRGATAKIAELLRGHISATLV